MERTGTDELNIDKVSNDIKTAFPKLNNDDFREALKNGGLGKYGRTYKLTTQELCIWIRNYINENPKIGKTNQPIMQYDKDGNLI